MTTAIKLGMQIGEAMAKDVIAEDMPRKWKGLSAEGTAQIPSHLDSTEVSQFAEERYRELIQVEEQHEAEERDRANS